VVRSLWLSSKEAYGEEEGEREGEKGEASWDTMWWSSKSHPPHLVDWKNVTFALAGLNMLVQVTVDWEGREEIVVVIWGEMREGDVRNWRGTLVSFLYSMTVDGRMVKFGIEVILQRGAPSLPVV